MTHAMISKYRKELMGFATLWVALLHSSMWFRTPLLEGFKEIGHCGVDIFIFLSALGLYFALQKGEKKTTFWKRRLVRILPAFLIAASFREYYLKISWTETWQLLTTLSFWISFDRSMWYISAILVLYLIAPFYYDWFHKGNEEKKTILMIVLSVAFGMILRNTQQMLFYARLPIFFLGFLAGKYAFEKKSVSKKTRVIALVSLAIGLIWNYWVRQLPVDESVLWGLGLFWYPNFFLVWPICLLLPKLFALCDKIHFPEMGHFFAKVGTVSLEYYLLFETVLKVCENVFMVVPYYDYNKILFNIGVMIVVYICAWVLHRILRPVQNWLEKSR